MAEVITVTEKELDKLLLGDKPVMILLTNGEGLRGEFSTAFKKAVEDHPTIVFARIDPTAYPSVAQRFEVSSKPVLIGWYCGDEILRRSRPWGSDVPLAVEQMQSAVKERQPAPAAQQPVKEPPVENKMIVESAPVKVTDATFEQEVLLHDKPVLVDFWAEWCGPCRMVAPTLDKLAKEFAGQIRIAKVNVDENPGLSQYFKVMSIPTIMLIKNRTIVFQQPGALPEAGFRDLINQLIKLEVPPPKAEPQPAANPPLA